MPVWDLGFTYYWICSYWSDFRLVHVLVRLKQLNIRSRRWDRMFGIFTASFHKYWFFLYARFALTCLFHYLIPQIDFWRVTWRFYSLVQVTELNLIHLFILLACFWHLSNQFFFPFRSLFSFWSKLSNFPALCWVGWCLNGAMILGLFWIRTWNMIVQLVFWWHLVIV